MQSGRLVAQHLFTDTLIGLTIEETLRLHTADIRQALEGTYGEIETVYQIEGDRIRAFFYAVG